MDTLIQLRAASPFLQRCETPIGRVEVLSDGEAVTSVALEQRGSLPHDGLAYDSDAVADEAVAQLLDYFQGVRRRFTVPVAHHGTPFQHAVWAVLAELRWGEHTSYGAIARAVGRAGSGRAVGGAIAINPTPLIVGCHRVLSATGRVTGWSWGDGAATKARLLAHEGIPFIP
ncbi:methylated-DNA--[protein]-cysteine S-methyltransferase [Herbiconiux moechotypicola]|uniref:Methylated-DNA--[protein]-cysteine S-methyltransferase n=1 Tax=Herbiconiux moechotypicola TaxID=637393 RepID=A0ABN3D7T7_9MICO|nr:methylated-DNA--[protein]-cysteine S-methyltransferase [Herbiconiux moechotypicola]MCS5728441.1 methylated-DNA--[protein]-cysteine S-methyltransferase [Herbiconiux moechotypicola]